LAKVEQRINIAGHLLRELAVLRKFDSVKEICVLVILVVKTKLPGVLVLVHKLPDVLDELLEHVNLLLIIALYQI